MYVCNESNFSSISYIRSYLLYIAYSSISMLHYLQGIWYIEVGYLIDSYCIVKLFAISIRNNCKWHLHDF